MNGLEKFLFRSDILVVHDMFLAVKRLIFGSVIWPVFKKRVSRRDRRGAEIAEKRLLDEAPDNIGPSSI